MHGARLALPAVRRLAGGDRAAILEHLLALAPDDRYGRFASALSDHAIAGYVTRIALDRDLAFGIGGGSGRLFTAALRHAGHLGIARVHLATGHPAALHISWGLGDTVETRPTSPRATISLSSTGQ